MQKYEKHAVEDRHQGVERWEVYVSEGLKPNTFPITKLYKCKGMAKICTTPCCETDHDLMKHTAQDTHISEHQTKTGKEWWKNVSPSQGLHQSPVSETGD